MKLSLRDTGASKSRANERWMKSRENLRLMGRPMKRDSRRDSFIRDIFASAVRT